MPSETQSNVPYISRERERERERKGIILLVLASIVANTLLGMKFGKLLVDGAKGHKGLFLFI